MLFGKSFQVKLEKPKFQGGINLLDIGGIRKDIRPQWLLCSNDNLVPRPAQKESHFRVAHRVSRLQTDVRLSFKWTTHSLFPTCSQYDTFISLKLHKWPHTKSQLPNRHIIIYSSCPWKPAPCGWEQLKTWNDNPHVLEGALVGGPGELSGNFIDDRQRFEFTEVATDYNSGFVGAVAGLFSISQVPRRLLK